jgi:hypothetical protein
MVKIWLYASLDTSVSSGWANWPRMTPASRPAMRKNANEVTM